MMKICFATYQSVMLLRGGPRTQILQTQRGLEALGVTVCPFDATSEFKKEQFDLVHLFGANIGTYHLARELHKLSVPMVVSPIFFSRHSWPLVRTVVLAESVMRKVARGVWQDYALAAEICRWSRAILPNSASEGQLVEKGLGIPSGRIQVVPNGVEGRFEHGDPSLFRREYNIDGPFVLNVGHIGPERKNVLKLIQAMEKINVRGVIVGRIEDTPYGRQCVEEAKKNPRLTLIDSLPHDSEMLQSAYSACDVFALPSQFETPGIAALEAGLAGAKVVITKHGGTEEYFVHHAEYVEPTSWELIHHGIVTALNKPKDDALRQHIKRHFLWERIAEQTKAVYESVLAQR